MPYRSDVLGARTAADPPTPTGVVGSDADAELSLLNGGGVIRLTSAAEDEADTVGGRMPLGVASLSEACLDTPGVTL